jgi:hypothetical protein
MHDVELMYTEEIRMDEAAVQRCLTKKDNLGVF